MPKYTCERCLKEFSQKSHFDKHQNKKIPCQDNKGKIEEVVENIIINKKLNSNKFENIITQNMDIDLQEFIKCDVFTPDDMSKLMASKFYKRICHFLAGNVYCRGIILYNRKSKKRKL